MINNLQDKLDAKAQNDALSLEYLKLENDCLYMEEKLKLLKQRRKVILNELEPNSMIRVINRIYINNILYTASLAISIAALFIVVLK